MRASSFGWRQVWELRPGLYSGHGGSVFTIPDPLPKPVPPVPPVTPPFPPLPPSPQSGGGPTLAGGGAHAARRLSSFTCDNVGFSEGWYPGVVDAEPCSTVIYETYGAHVVAKMVVPVRALPSFSSMLLFLSFVRLFVRSFVRSFVLSVSPACRV